MTSESAVQPWKHPTPNPYVRPESRTRSDRFRSVSAVQFWKAYVPIVSADVPPASKTSEVSAAHPLKA